MRLPSPPTAALAATLLLLLIQTPATTDAHNITKILDAHPSLSTFNHYLTVTHLAAEINRRLTITVLAVDNAGMASLLSKHLSVGTIKNVLSLHVLVDYYGTKKLHQLSDRSTLSSTLFQATGAAAGTSGYINITDLNGGKVGFGAEDNGGTFNSFFVKSVEEKPYNISVLEISQVLTSAEAEAPASGPSDLNVTAIMTKEGCKAFADFITAAGAASTYQENTDGGLTVFCPSDAVVNAFLTKHKNLTKSQRLSLALFHAFPVFESLQMLKSNNGVMNTLATDGASKYELTIQNDGEDIQLETKVVTATITGTLTEVDPLIIYKIDKVLQPTELFKAAAAPAPKSAKKKKSTDDDEADSPDADSPDGDSADATADSDSNAAAGVLGGRRLVGVALSLAAMFFVVA